MAEENEDFKLLLPCGNLLGIFHSTVFTKRPIPGPSPGPMHFIDGAQSSFDVLAML